MKLFIICRQFYDFEKQERIIGGIQTYLRQLVRLAEANGYALTILQCAAAPCEKLLNAAGSLRVVGVPTQNKKFVRALLQKAERLGDPERDLLLFATSTIIEKHGFRKSLAIQHGIYWDIETIHGKHPPFPLDLALRAVQARRIISQHRQVSRMVCVDYNYVNWLRSLTVDRSLAYTVIPNTASLPETVPVRSGPTVRMVFARRFVEIRGVRLLTKVLPQLLRRFPQLSLTLAGSGPLEAELRECFAGFDRVNFCSYDPDESIPFHAQFDIAVVPTVGSEGTSLSLLEAMAAGCAVVCSDVGGMSNLILDRYNGRILPPEPEAFDTALTELIEDETLRRRLAENGRATLKSSFSQAVWEERWRSVLRQFEA
jgi:Glycosyltransferase